MPAHRTRDTPARSLEVTTDAPQPPTVAIISPTPRVFSFPINNDSPSPSPSSSPFDPDVNPFATVFESASSPATSIARTLSPAESVSSDSSTPPARSNHKRQKSTQSTSSDTTSERRPKKGDEGYIKRPENAFILFRRKCCEERKELLQQLEESSEGASTKRQRQADLSKLISQQWKALPAEDRLHWEELAKEKKKEHEKMYPDYVYRPQRSKRKGKGKKCLGDDEHEQTDGESVPLTLHAPTMRGHGRSSSAPTPPPGYGSIQLPSVFMPSCPSSPSLLPMISKRPHRPSNLHQSSTPFDFFPGESIPPASFQQPTRLSTNAYNFGFASDNMGLSSKENPLLLPPLALPNDYQLVSPSDTAASASSGPPSPQHQSPFTPQFVDSALPATSIHEPHALHASWMYTGEIDVDAHMQMGDFQIYQEPSACPQWGESQEWPQDVGVGSLDEFELASIPELELGLSRFDEFRADGSSSSGTFAQGEGPSQFQIQQATYQQQNAQDQLEGMFALDGMDFVDGSHHNGGGAI